jgi:hypothetical protein
MANYKRKRPKNSRSGCLMCKYWKINGFSRLKDGFERHSSHKRRFFAKKEVENANFDGKNN